MPTTDSDRQGGALPAHSQKHWAAPLACSHCPSSIPLLHPRTIAGWAPRHATAQPRSLDSVGAAIVAPSNLICTLQAARACMHTCPSHALSLSLCRCLNHKCTCACLLALWTSPGWKWNESKSPSSSRDHVNLPGSACHGLYTAPIQSPELPCPWPVPMAYPPAQFMSQA